MVRDESGLAETHTFKYGVTDRFDVRVTVGGSWSEPRGIDTVNVLLKANLKPPDEGVTGVTVSTYYNAPTAIGSNRPGFGAMLIASLPYRGFQLDTNAVVDVAPVAENDLAFVISPIATLSVPLVGDAGGFVESVLFIPASAGKPSSLAGGGLSWKARPNLILDIALHGRVAGDVPRYRVDAGLTFAFWGRPQ